MSTDRENGKSWENSCANGYSLQCKWNSDICPVNVGKYCKYFERFKGFLQSEVTGRMVYFLMFQIYGA